MLRLHSSWCAGKCLATHVEHILVGMKHVVRVGECVYAQILAHKYHLPKKSESQQKRTDSIISLMVCDVAVGVGGNFSEEPSPK